MNAYKLLSILNEHSDGFSCKYPLRILIHEEYNWGQLILTRLLKYLGYQVTALVSLQNILPRLKLQYFDLCFISLNTSSLDFTALKAYLAQKKFPHIAVGRYNHTDDYKTYVDLALDDYITLPVSTIHIQNVLRHWYFRLRFPEKIPSLEAFNTAELLARINYNIDTLEELSSLFQEDAKRLLVRAHNALRENDSLQLKKATHELKGICTTLSAKKMRQLAIEMEKTASSQQAFPLLEELEKECLDIQNALKNILQFF